MRIVSLLLLATAAPAMAQASDPNALLLQRLEALETRVRELEAANARLEAGSKATEQRAAAVAAQAPTIRFNPAPLFTSADRNFTFKPRGAIQIDYAAFDERKGGYDYSDGTDLRRARIGFEGTALGKFSYRIEGEMTKRQATLYAVNIQYPLSDRWAVTLGQLRAPFGLEGATQEISNSFLERAMANNAMGSIGSERRVGVTFAYSGEKLHSVFGLYGASEEVVRNNVTPDEPWGVNGRVAWEPINSPGNVLHFGVAGFRATNFGGNSLPVVIRPGTRVETSSLQSVTYADAASAVFTGVEFAWVRGPFSLQAEYGRVAVDRITRHDVDLDGYYVFGSWFPTGQSRSFVNGIPTRVAGFPNFDPAKGNWGAVELLLRYDRARMDADRLGAPSHVSDSITAGLNWFLTPYTRFILNYVRFNGTNSPLAIDSASNGTAAGDIYGARLSFDF